MTRNTLSIKVCGMAHETNVAEVSALAPEYMGFIFHEHSPRNAASLAPEAVGRLQRGITAVGVFVDKPSDKVASIAHRYGIHTVQLHGEEPPEECIELKRQGFTVWKAVGVDGMVDPEALRPYCDSVACFVFDTKSRRHGGTGVKYDWEYLRSYTLDIPLMLSGGISPDDAGRILEFHHPMLAGVDVNSRFEDAPGIKNTARLNEFINKIRHCQKAM